MKTFGPSVLIAVMLALSILDVYELNLSRAWASFLAAAGWFLYVKEITK